MKLSSLRAYLMAVCIATIQNASALSVSKLRMSSSSTCSKLMMSSEDNFSVSCSRRESLHKVASGAFFVGSIVSNSNRANAITPVNVEGGNLPDLPPDAARSYLQYRVPLQIAADYYVFDLQPKMANIDDWGDINQLFQTNNNKGQGQPNKIERDYTNIMRIIGLSMPPDEADDIRASQFKFERAMQGISKAVSGVRRDLPVEIDPSTVVAAQKGWDDGRIALNDFFTQLNVITGLNEMKLIPPPGSDQFKAYGRSPRKYFELAKKTKLCQNRGGPALSQAWGQLMISGYLQDNMDSCGIPDLNDYFYQ
mmetsp:Transcript_19102/g.26900  ORF Transcript_19102/g.26900 Transcript_19102/m.26900 type:complete len:309 (-) Transcript_19102:314-1240(-)